MKERLPAERLAAEALAAYPPQVRSLMLEIPTIRDDEARARRIGDLFAEVLIDLEADRAARAFIVGMLREGELRHEGFLAHLTSS